VADCPDVYRSNKGQTVFGSLRNMDFPVVFFEGFDMSSSGRDFERYANAERQLCDEAAPLLVSIIRDIETRMGIRIAEVRVTLDGAHSTGALPVANCTIVRAHDASAARDSARPIDGDRSSTQSAD
jgi:hypothetical protein